MNCSYDPYTSEDSHFEDAGVRCFSENGKNAIPAHAMLD